MKHDDLTQPISCNGKYQCPCRTCVVDRETRKPLGYGPAVLRVVPMSPRHVRHRTAA